MTKAVAALLCAISAAPAVAHAQCQLFDHKGFLGDSMTIGANQSRPHLGTLNDRVSSIKVSASCLLVAYADADYQGATTTFSPGEHASLIEGWDDQISSAHCNCR